MYILIRRGINGIEWNEVVSDKKGVLIEYLTGKGYKYSKKHDSFISQKSEFEYGIQKINWI